MNVNASFPVEAEMVGRSSYITEWILKRRWFFAFVVLPTLVAAVYYGFIASDIYVSESRFVIKSADQKRPQLSTLANLVQTTGISVGQEQANEVLTFVRSRDALKVLNHDIAIRSKFASSSADVFSRFPGPLSKGSFEDLFKFYRKKVDARLDTETGTAAITVEAFTSKDAYIINRRLLELSEELVNRLNARAQAKAISEAQRQVELATVRAKAARVALASYRNAKALIDPGKQAVSVLEIANVLVSQRAALQAQLDQMTRLTPTNPSIPALRSRISAISAQIASQDSRVVGSDQGIASKMGGYENLLVEQEFATANLNAANAALVQAHTDAQRQQFYLERVVDPDLPDSPVLPKRLLSVLVVAAAAACLYFVAWMFVVGVIEHAPER